MLGYDKNSLLFRKRALDISYQLHRFLADHRDLTAWIGDMKAVIAADELAKDVAGAEALLESHQEHKCERRIPFTNLLITP